MVIIIFIFIKSIVNWKLYITFAAKLKIHGRKDISTDIIYRGGSIPPFSARKSGRENKIY